MAEPTIAVVGPGAIGTTVAAALHEIGRTPQLYGRSRRQQLLLDTPDERITVPGPVVTNPEDAGTPVDLLFLSVKATQIDASAAWLTALCADETVVCVLQNGVEQVAMVRPHTPAAKIVPSIVWFPAEAQPDHSVRLRGAPRLTVPAVEPTRIISEVLAGSRIAVERAEDFTTEAWRKLIQNAIAGLMVLTRRRSGMFQRDDVVDLAIRYARECLTVARAEGAKLSDSTPEEVVAVFQGHPSDMGTSILADREAGRPLEWRTRNGVIARLGRAHGIATPVSDVLVPLLAAASDGPG
ncbi:oxidoreductase [Microbacterium sp.]|uniref:oxidoreductase n=1 Tax=Microbacterium sp. TaxID=51671 RepID=UPI003C710A85